jgi:hypothetical protein
MAKKCAACKYFTEENAPQSCPNCGAELKFTMLGGVAIESDPARPAWAIVDPDDVITVEQCLSLRLGQITTAIGFYWLFWFFGGPYLGALLVQLFATGDTDAALMISKIAVVAFFVLAALIAGGIAGASTIKWFPQGLAVGTGLILIWLVALELFGVESQWPYLASSILAIPGAYLGHLIMGPARIIQSLGDAT